MYRGIKLLLVFMFSVQVATADDSSVPDLLQAMADASRNLTYRGHLIHVRGNDIATLQVLHAVINGREYERITHLDGQRAEIIRAAGQVICIHADDSMTRITGKPHLLDKSDRLARVLQYYEVVAHGHDRVAGRSVRLLHLLPRDQERYGYRFWLDTQTSLLLRFDLIGLGGAVLERVEFVSLDLQPALSESDFIPPADQPQLTMPGLDEPSQLETPVRLSMGWVPKGFQVIGRDLRRQKPDDHPVLSRTFSDGLAAFTIFVEKTGSPAADTALTRTGPTVAATRYLDSGGFHYQVTLVGEVPESTAKRLMMSLAIQEGQGP